MVIPPTLENQIVQCLLNTGMTVDILAHKILIKLRNKQAHKARYNPLICISMNTLDLFSINNT